MTLAMNAPPPSEPKAVIFDLDDTLYALRRFVHSGFLAVADHLAETHGVDRRRAMETLAGASRGTARGRELQACIVQFGLSPALVPELVQLIRQHRPSLRLPRASRLALAALRAGWRLGIVSNGLPEIQARKVAALGLPLLVDTIVYANDFGTGAGKPEREPFLAAAQQLGVVAERAIFVGDDPRCDVLGASRAGMKTIQLTRRGHAIEVVSVADATVASLAEVPAVAERLVAEARWSAHAV